MYVTAFRMYKILVSLTLLVDSVLQFSPILRALIIGSYLLFCLSRLVATSQSRRRDYAQGLPVATRPDLARSVRRLIFAAKREGLLVF